MKETPLGTNPTPQFEDGPDPGLEPVGGEFQPPFAIVLFGRRRPPYFRNNGEFLEWETE
jgi:hypothetical protein